MSETVTLADIERLCWHLSGWDVEQRAVDELLAAIRAHLRCGCSGAVAPLVSGGAGDEIPVSVPERPAAPLTAPVGYPETSEGANGPQEGVQRIEITGTLTLVCSHGQSAAKSTPRKVITRAKPVEELVPEHNRVCRKCTSRRPIEEFVRDTHGLRGRKTTCRECENKRKRDASRLKRQQRNAQAA